MKTETRNLGDLFREKLKGQSIDYSHRDTMAFKEKIDARKKKGNNQTTRKQIQKVQGDSGIKNIAKIRSFDYKQGFYFKFTFSKASKKQSVQSKTLLQLYNKVIDLGYDFIIADKKKARLFIKNNCNDKDCQILLDKLFNN